MKRRGKMKRRIARDTESTEHDDGDEHAKEQC